MTKAAKSDLTTTIERAWSDTPRPPEGGVTISPDKYDDRAELEQALSGRHWRAIPHETLFSARMDLPALSPEGLRYFLPAFLLAALEDNDEDKDIRCFLLLHFQVSVHDGTLSKELACFSPAERDAVRAFFEYMVATDGEEWRALAAAV